MRGRVLTTNLDTDIGRMAMQVGDQNLADQHVEVRLIIQHGLQLGGEGAESIRRPERRPKRADKCTAIILPRTAGG